VWPLKAIGNDRANRAVVENPLLDLCAQGSPSNAPGIPGASSRDATSTTEAMPGNDGLAENRPLWVVTTLTLRDAPVTGNVSGCDTLTFANGLSVFG
jgi:hypothetical protein